MVAGCVSAYSKPSGGKYWRFQIPISRQGKHACSAHIPACRWHRPAPNGTKARKILAEGKDPVPEKEGRDKIAAAFASANTFGAIAAEHFANLKQNGAAQVTIDKNRWLLEDLATPLAKRPISESRRPNSNLLKFEKAGKRETARRLRGTVGAVFRLAIVTSRDLLTRLTRCSARCCGP